MFELSGEYPVAHFIGICFALLLIVLITWNLITFIFSAFFSHLSHLREEFTLKSTTNIFPLQRKYDTVLHNNFPYYKNLSPKSRHRFLLRLDRFVRKKRITGAGDFVVTEEIKAMVGAAAIQLTFGLERFWMGHFHRFIIYPDAFHNKFHDRYHRGETNPHGVVVLSWKHFCEGYNNGSDKINLGLHEMAHALDLSRIEHDSDPYFKEYYKKWSLVSMHEYNRMQEEPSFLRQYGSANFREFFAVCVEHFFEAPADFKKELPDIYMHLVTLLRQDPLTGMEDYNASNFSVTNFIDDNELLKEPVFSSHITLWHSAWTTFIVFIRLLLLSVALIFLMNKIVVISLVLGLFFWIHSLLYTRFELYDKYFILRRPLLNGKYYSFAIENIISISFQHDRYNFVTVTYLEKGEIKNSRYICTINTMDEKELLGLLKTRNIHTTNW